MFTRQLPQSPSPTLSESPPRPFPDIHPSKPEAQGHTSPLLLSSGTLGPCSQTTLQHGAEQDRLWLWGNHIISQAPLQGKGEESRVGGLEGDKTQLFGEDFLEEALSELSKC